LETRYTLQGWKSPFRELFHVDLLHLARRLWRDRLPSRTLANLEIQILHASRTDEEIPGWMIPQIYFDYLRDGDARPLKRVFYHNAMDVVSLAALLNHTSLLLEEPTSQPLDDYSDLAAVARLMEELGHAELAVNLFNACLSSELPGGIYNDTLMRLSYIYKRKNDYLAAIPLWEKAAANMYIGAFEELAKYYEHRALDIPAALQWTYAALELLESGKVETIEVLQWRLEYMHRLERLERKLSSRENKSEAASE
ncbi:MAG TPA: ribonuclease H-like domain-containing protein, partial [Anaerolineales bacterium]